MHPYDGLAPRSVAVMDNCSIHHVNTLTNLFQEAGIVFIFLSPYSPDYNPIELAFSKVKYFFKEHDSVMQAMGGQTHSFIAHLTILLLKCVVHGYHTVDTLEMILYILYIVLDSQ